jgi:hypothetical protein
MDSLTIIASIASIASLIFHLSGKASALRQFTFPTTTALVGFAIGRHHNEVGQGSSLLLQDPYLLFMLVIMLILFALAMYLVESNKSEAKISFIFLVFISTIVLPQLIKSYNELAPMVATQDYLTLARVKESTGNTEEAIKYLKIYSKRIGRVELEKQVATKIENLRKQQFKQELNPKEKSKAIE